ncbi:hypothetical protein [Companilactobacillus alimentarius]|uniref:hypothetical protein n=1 Tax=Companilactobacillus alimentarius TaxID=1602 RepID=UPI0028B709DC|nr:hypothetical protein [Companilactobacillus alimentarius]MDT6951825.1 hypothetical protein [Companilactobacillus alimentarius]
MNLKIGGSNVGKIMYGGQEFGGATKLEPGTVLYMSKTRETSFKSVHLSSTTKDWNNINGINVGVYDRDFSKNLVDSNITGDDFKNLDKAKSFSMEHYSTIITVSRSIVDGEYRLNVSSSSGAFIFAITAI